jgi:hypothetical protein
MPAARLSNRAYALIMIVTSALLGLLVARFCVRVVVVPSTPGAPVAGAPSASVPNGASDSASGAGGDAEGPGTRLFVLNATDKDTVVYVAFGSDSVIRPAAWPFCAGAGLNCSFPLGKKNQRMLTLAGRYLNATFTFGAAVGCGTTKAEVNLNNPSWYDTADISLVDGFSNFVFIEADDKRLGPGHGKTGNEKVFGMYPLGCDLCAARGNPPCGIAPGNAGCKGGTQYKPDVPCQWQGSTKGGGGKVEIVLVEPVPA